MIRRRDIFTTIRTEGSILPADVLRRISELDKTLDGLTPTAYHLDGGEKINEAISQSWSRVQGAWNAFQSERVRLAPTDRGTTITRERWLLPLFNELRYGRLQAARGVEVEENTVPLSHLWQSVPIHLVGCNIDLDRRTPGAAGAAEMSPHGLVQNLLNAAPEYLWGLVSNGLRLRVLRDNSSLTRQAYVEFDLEQMMSGAEYSDFALLWLVCHESSFEAERAGEFRIEKWSRTGQEQGLRVRDRLRDGVKAAIESLGRGLLAHRESAALRVRVHRGELSAQDFYRQVLRLVYRLLFLLIAEDRDLLLLPGDEYRSALARYTSYYSIGRLRRLAARRASPGHHDDLYRALSLIFERLGSAEGYPALALPALGGFLFSERAVSDLAGCQIENSALLDAVRALVYTVDKSGRRLVDYKNLGTEELGSVYESLLELHPAINVDSATFTLNAAAGNERKTTGSYYTPPSLVSCLLDSALDPVLDEAAKKPNAAEAILSLKVCDPACGSGHFLIAAAHRIARRLAIARTGEDEPSPQHVRDALHDVIARCLFGVDINEMAGELCKFALWIESMVPGKALSFLDHHIRSGNSLLGTTPALMAKGIPDEAFTPIEGDDKEYCKLVKAQNKRERTARESGQEVIDLTARQIFDSIGQSMERLSALGDGSVEEERRKEELYEQLAGSSDFMTGRYLADAWCAAFVWKKRKDPTGKLLFPITDQVYHEIEKYPHRYSDWLAPEVVRLRDHYQFFHWHLAFPTVFRLPAEGETPENEQCCWNGGFDVILGNPPWERIKLQEREWFATCRPAIANAATAAMRRRMIDDLAGNDPELYAAFIADCRKAEGESHLIRCSGSYPYGAVGDTNTYPLFIELAYNLSARYIGIIVKTGILADFSMRGFFSHIVENGRLAVAHDFSNKKLIFPAVVANERFLLLTMKPSGPSAIPFLVSILNEDALDIEKGRVWSISDKDIRLINPNTRTCPLFQLPKDAEIVERVYNHLPVMVREVGRTYENTIGVEYWTMFHMTNDSEHFIGYETLQSIGGTETGGTWEVAGEKYIPLLEGKLFDSFDHRHGSFEGTPAHERFGIKAEPNHLTGNDKANPSSINWPRYWVLSSESSARYDGRLGREPGGVLAFRDVCRTHTDMRTVRAAICPAYGAGNKAPLLLFPSLDPLCSALRSVVLCSMMNSFVFDYIARQKFAGGSLNRYILVQLPVIDASRFRLSTPFATNTVDCLIQRAFELTYTAYDLTPFARDCGYEGEPFIWDEDRRFLLRSELDAAYFHLYGINRDDTDYIMDTFPIVRRKDMDKYGEYRTKRVILEIYDEMAEAMRTGIPYQTRLDPPPANGWIPPEEAFRDLETPATSTPAEHAGAPNEPAELVLVSPDPDIRQPRLDFSQPAEETFVLVNGHRARLLHVEPKGAATKYLVHVDGEPAARAFLVPPAVVEMVVTEDLPT